MGENSGENLNMYMYSLLVLCIVGMTSALYWRKYM
jgi:hypothetical protein